MELRVWVDGAQRVVCGVKLTTTCQEIVFALAHATQQAGRFTMIERWRNNERLLSPNEQPLVTLQRWGDHMNEVEFILRKTSTDLPPATNQQPSATNQQLQSQPRPMQQQDPLRTNNHDNEPMQQVIKTNGIRESPCNSMPALPNQQLVNDQLFDNMYQNHQYNLNRRPQTVLGTLTSSNSTLGLGPNYSQQNLARLPNSFRASMSTSMLPNATNNMTASPSNNAPWLRPHYTDDQMIITNSAQVPRHNQNGYPIHSETQPQHQKITNQMHNDQTQVSKNHPFEDLYSTVNKKRTNQPPAVPAKPRVVGQIGPVTNLSMPHQQLQPINNAQMNFYHPNQSPLNIYPSSMRPRHPPGYLDYMEAMANRNSIQPLPSNQTYAQQHSQHSQGNIFQRSFDIQQMYNMQQVGSSPASHRYRYSVNGPLNANHDPSRDIGANTAMHNVNPICSKLMDSGIVINRGSAKNVKLPPSNHNHVNHVLNACDPKENSVQNNDNSNSVCQMGHDMLKLIEEQKKVLINQKNELDRLDNDQEYWETKQNSEETELINRIENEIRQLEDLWKENQAQILKLENHDFEKELQSLKSEQVRMELEIGRQKAKLLNCERDIVRCKSKIEQLETELVNQESEPDETLSSSNGEGKELYMNIVNQNISKDSAVEAVENESPNKSVKLSMHTNGTDHSSDQLNKEAKSSEDEDYEEDSGGDLSDDLNLPIMKNKHRSAKDVANVDKRGLISGIRSLKLDKSRVLESSRDLVF